MPSRYEPCGYTPAPRPILYTLHLTPCTPHPAPCTPHPAPPPDHTPIPYTLNLTPSTSKLKAEASTPTQAGADGGDALRDHPDRGAYWRVHPELSERKIFIDSLLLAYWAESTN